MSELVIETHDLRKEFRTRRGRHVVAVDGLDLAVPRGGVHGFLGPNGSGKTTTIRMLLGLASATAGQMHLFGEPVPRRLPSVVNRIGAVVEQPKFLPSFSARRNLSLLAGSIGAPRTEVDRALEQVGLAGRDRDRFKTFSLGMKQRLAIAATLLKHPDLLILDEPSNGLDPAGIREIRELIRDLAETGVTVLLSSHILAEVQQVCHSVSIIGGGRLLASGAVEDLVSAAGVGSYHVVVADPDAAATVLTRAGRRVTRDGTRLTVEGGQTPTGDLGEDISRLLADERIYLRELQPVRDDLESVFLRLTHGDTLHAGAGSDPGRHTSRGGAR